MSQSLAPDAAGATPTPSTHGTRPGSLASVSGLNRHTLRAGVGLSLARLWQFLPRRLSASRGHLAAGLDAAAAAWTGLGRGTFPASPRPTHGRASAAASSLGVAVVTRPREVPLGADEGREARRRWHLRRGRSAGFFLPRSR